MKPIIGLTMHADRKTLQVNDTYIQAIIQAGGIPICLPYLDGPDSIHIMNKIDGLLLIGGHDIDPRFYDADPHPKLGEIIKQRDESELAYFYEAFELDIPIFGICRGHQLLNVALGGTLLQDIESQREHVIKHSQVSERGETTHKVTIFKSRLQEILGQDLIYVNSFHHQAVHRIADELVEVAISADGIVEALEHREKFYCLSVQWHPEELAVVQDEHALKLFSSFVEACVQKKQLKVN